MILFIIHEAEWNDIDCREIKDLGKIRKLKHKSFSLSPPTPQTLGLSKINQCTQLLKVSDTITDMPMHPKIASGWMLAVIAAEEPPRTSSDPIRPHLHFQTRGVLLPGRSVFPGRAHAYSWKRGPAFAFAFIGILGELVASPPANPAERDGFQGHFTLVERV